MAEKVEKQKRKTLIDYGVQVIRELVKEKQDADQPVGIEDIKLDDIKREKIRLEQEERKMLNDLRDFENQKRKLFEDGVRNASEREQRVIARRIKELDMQATNMDHMMQAISKQMRIINGLIQVKERARLNKESGLIGVLQNMDLGDLITFIDRSSVDGEFNMTKFDEILRAMEHSEAVSPQYSEDQDVMDIVKEMQLAREAMDDPASLEKHYTDLTRKMESKEKETPEEEY